MRELKVTKRRLDQFESTATTVSVSNSNDITSIGSRTSSSTSINTTGNVIYFPILICALS